MAREYPQSWKEKEWSLEIRQSHGTQTCEGGQLRDYLSRQEREKNYSRPLGVKTGTERGPAKNQKKCDNCGTQIKVGQIYEEDFVTFCAVCSTPKEDDVAIVERSSEGWCIFDDLTDEWEKIIELDGTEPLEKVKEWAKYQGFKTLQIMNDNEFRDDLHAL